MQVTTAPLFAAALTPHRSMSPKGLRIVIGLVALLAAIPILVFFSVGAWPVAGFMGLDVLAIGFALWKSFDAGKRREDVTLYSDKLEVLFVAANGQQDRKRFNPMTVRLVIERDMNERTTAMKLRTREGDTVVGSFLTQEERSSFAKAFGTALRKARA